MTLCMKLCYTNKRAIVTDKHDEEQMIYIVAYNNWTLLKKKHKKQKNHKGSKNKKTKKKTKTKAGRDTRKKRRRQAYNQQTQWPTKEQGQGQAYIYTDNN